MEKALVKRMELDLNVALKILTGPQMGAELLLPPGDYAIGSSEDADLYLADVAVLARHAVLHVGDGGCGIEPAVPDAVVDVDGVAISGRTALAMYQVVTLGGTHLAVGPDGQWEKLPTPPVKVAEAPPFATEPANKSASEEHPADLEPEPVPANAAVADAEPAASPQKTRRRSLFPLLFLFLLLAAGLWALARFVLIQTPEQKLAAKTAANLRDMGINVVYPGTFSPDPGVIALAVTAEGRISLAGLVGNPEDKRDVLAAAQLPENIVADRIRVLTSEVEQVAAGLRRDFPFVALDTDEDNFIVAMTGMVDSFSEYSQVSRLVRAALPAEVPLRNRLIVWEDAQGYVERAGARLGLERFRLRRDGAVPNFSYAHHPTHEQTAALRKLIRDNYGKMGLDLFGAALHKMDEPPPPPPVMIVEVMQPELEPEPEPEPEPQPEPEPVVAEISEPELVPEPPPPAKPEKQMRKIWRIQTIDASGFVDQSGRKHRVGGTVGGYRLVDTWSEGIVLKFGKEIYFVKKGKAIVDRSPEATDST